MIVLRPYLDPHMSPPEDPKRPLPSADEINAYLELSAARTKKRLPLAFGTTGAPRAPARERKLRVAGAAPAPQPAADATVSSKPEPSKPEPSKKPSGS